MSTFFSRTHTPLNQLAIVILAVITVIFCLLCPPALSESTAQPPQQQNFAAKSTSLSNLLIVQLANNADRQKFDDILQEIHGKLLKTIDFGPTLSFLLIEPEAGKISETEKKLLATKDVAYVQRNLVCQFNDVVTESVAAKHASFGKVFLPKNRSLRFALPKTHHAGKGLLIPAASAHLSPNPNDPYFYSQWDLALMKFPQARSAGLPTGVPVMFYFLDTGVTPFSAELATSAAQYDFSNPLVNPVRESPYDSSTHGTGTASVTATTNNSIGYAGAANLEGNRCFLFECRLTTGGGIQTATVASILSALSYLYQTPGLSPGPINISVGSAPPNTLNSLPAIQEAAQLLSNKGFLVVIAAGNNGAYDPSPERYARRVAAIGGDGNIASFSNYGPFPAAAPGASVQIYTPTGPDIQTLGSGTSFAAPRWCAAIVDVMGVLPPSRRTAVFADSIVMETAIINAQGLRIPNLQAATALAAQYH